MPCSWISTSAKPGYIPADGIGQVRLILRSTTLQFICFAHSTDFLTSWIASRRICGSLAAKEPQPHLPKAQIAAQVTRSIYVARIFFSICAALPRIARRSAQARSLDLSRVAAHKLYQVSGRSKKRGRFPHLRHSLASREAVCKLRGSLSTMHSRHGSSRNFRLASLGARVTKGEHRG